MDVVALIFDYIFRDPSIPESQRRVFARLQVPIAKAALLDRSFFSDRNHPARRLLDDLAAAAVGAQGNDDYRTAFDALAREIVDRIAADFGVDVAVFEAADAEIRPFTLHEQTVAAVALHDDIDTALAAEASDADRAEVRALLRDKLAGLDIPFAVRSFTETLWADHLTAIRSTEGTAGRGVAGGDRPPSTTCCGASPPRSAARRRRGSRGSSPRCCAACAPASTRPGPRPSASAVSSTRSTGCTSTCCARRHRRPRRLRPAGDAAPLNARDGSPRPGSRRNFSRAGAGDRRAEGRFRSHDRARFRHRDGDRHLAAVPGRRRAKRRRACSG